MGRLCFALLVFSAVLRAVVGLTLTCRPSAKRWCAAREPNKRERHSFVSNDFSVAARDWGKEPPLLRMSASTAEEIATNVVERTPTQVQEVASVTINSQSDRAGAATTFPQLQEEQTVPSGVSSEEYNRGLITIGFITLLFSSNSPALHAAFSDSSQPPPVLLLNAAVSVVALVGLVVGGPLLEASTPLPSSLMRNQEREGDEWEKVRAGLELGLWKFLGTTANLYGLSLTTADHGAFLIQLTTLIVPVVQGIMGVPIPNRIVQSIGLALVGVFLFTQDASSLPAAADAASGAGGSTVPLGDALCVLAAGFYATYDLRLFRWGKVVPPRYLITSKIGTQALFSVVLLALLGYDETEAFISQALTCPQSGLTLLALLVVWSGVAVNAVAPFLQVGGQQAVGPTRAQTLYASQPLWASIMSFFFLGETIGLQGIVGGAAFLSALFLAATAEPPDPECGEKNCEVF